MVRDSGIAARYHAFLTDAVSSADIDRASGSRDYPLCKVALVQDLNRAAGNVSERCCAARAGRSHGIIDLLARYVDLTACFQGDSSEARFT